jgi:hypothetical protein
MYLVRAAKQAETEFMQAAYRITSRFHGVTLLNENAVDLAEAATFWKAAGTGTVQESATKRLDPIAGISTLSAALQLAGRLDVIDPDVIRSTAWIILLSNAIAHTMGIRPIDAYVRFRQTPYAGPWESIYSGIDERVRAELPDIPTMLEQARKCLWPWTPEPGRPRDWAVGFTETDGRIDWKVDVPVDYEPIEPIAGDLWLTTSSTTGEQTAKVLQCQAVPSITLAARTTEFGGVGPTIHSNDMPWIGVNEGGRAATYGWAPAQIGGDAYALLRNQETWTWCAVQIY